MRSLKLISVAILFATVLVNSANAGERSVQASNIPINITFQQAIQDPGLLAAMQEQLCAESLGGPGVQYVTFMVTYQDHFYLITGTYYQWFMFFKAQQIKEKVKSNI